MPTSSFAYCIVYFQILPLGILFSIWLRDVRTFAFIHFSMLLFSLSPPDLFSSVYFQLFSTLAEISQIWEIGFANRLSFYTPLSLYLFGVWVQVLFQLSLLTLGDCFFDVFWSRSYKPASVRNFGPHFRLFHRWISNRGLFIYTLEALVFQFWPPICHFW